MSSKSIMHASLASLRRGVSSFCRLSLPTRAVVCAAVGATTAVGCGWFGPSETVRFSGGYGEPNERLYSRLPMLSVGGDDSFTKREETEDWEDYEAEERNAREIAALWVKATDVSQAVGREGLERVRGDLREYLKESEPQGLDDNGRNTAIDLLDAFTALDKGSSPAAAQAYMKARQAYDAWLAAIHPEPVYVYPKPPARSDAEIAAENSEKLDALRHAIEEIPADRNLSDNVAYLRAAITYQEANYEDAAREFQSLTLHYPRSEKREASLLMEGLAQLKQSSSYKADDASALSSAPCAECRDDAWKAARAAFGRVIGEYPRGRYGRDARGWLAFTSLRVGDTGAGLAEYYRLLADESDVGERAEALNSLDMARFHADEAAMHKVEAELSNEPDAALAYAYHEIYNYVAGLNIYEAPVYERDEKQEHSTSSSDYVQRNKEAKRRLSDWRRKELRRVVEFAAVMLRRYPRTKVGGEFALRLAEANFESDDARAARDNAVRALGAGLVGARRVEALWVKGVAEYRLREYDAARRTLKTLLDEDPRGELSAGGRRLVAMIAEDAGDLDAALEQYLALDYKEDAAYFVDVLMTPEQLASFVERYPDLPQRDELLYALGVRYLRDNRFTEARAAYARVHTTRAEDSSCSYAYGCHANSRFGAASYEDESPKTYFGDSESGVDVRWVARDLQTINDLAAFDRAFASAQGDEAKAESLYQKASYIYESDLLFFNPAAWGYGRHYLLVDLDEGNLYRQPGEADLLFRYMQHHDMASRALDLYLEVVRRFPKTRAARDALYTAAVCHERLANYNNYWRDKYATGLHAGERMVTYADVRAAYPDYRLPRATMGWQPSTRTVNGKPGWDAPPKPPKPKPKPTRSQRAKLYAARAYSWLRQQWLDLWEGWLKRWLAATLLTICALRCHRFASRARVRLREQLVRLKPTHTCEPINETDSADTRNAITADAHAATLLPAPVAPWLVEEGSGMSRTERAAILARRLVSRGVNMARDGATLARRASRPAWRRVEPLLHDAHGRSVLAANAVSHGLLVVLLVELLRIMYAG